MAEDYTVEQGDSMSSIAYEHGFFWETLWHYAANAELKRLRKRPNILKPGDLVVIPPIQPKEESGATEKRHTFKRKGVPEKFNLQFLDYEGKPLADEPYLLIIDGSSSKGHLDGEGWIRVAIPPAACLGRVEVGVEGKLAACTLNFGHLDPVAEISGVQARLQNLGYYEGEVDGANNELLAQAVQAFCKDEEIPGKTLSDAAFQKKLEEVHKC